MGTRRLSTVSAEAPGYTDVPVQEGSRSTPLSRTALEIDDMNDA